MRKPQAFNVTASDRRHTLRAWRPSGPHSPFPFTHGGPEGGSGGKLTFGLLASVWAASNGMLAVVDALNAAYHVREARPWWKSRLVAALLTLALGALVVSALVLVVNSEIEKAAAKAGEPEAKLPGEKSPGEKGREGRASAAAA